MIYPHFELILYKNEPTAFFFSNRLFYDITKRFFYA